MPMMPTTCTMFTVFALTASMFQGGCSFVGAKRTFTGGNPDSTPAHDGDVRPRRMCVDDGDSENDDSDNSDECIGQGSGDIDSRVRDDFAYSTRGLRRHAFVQMM